MMTAYQLTHQHTANLHYCGPDSAGRPIIVDVAEITAGHFEIAAVWGNGDEIESDEVEDIDTARRLYSELLHKLTAPKPQQAAAKPLTGKYAKLRDDLKAALAAGRTVEDDDPEDGGACNFDAASLLHWLFIIRVVSQRRAIVDVVLRSFLLKVDVLHLLRRNTQHCGQLILILRLGVSIHVVHSMASADKPMPIRCRDLAATAAVLDD